jgi:hypothetical protein
VVEGPLAMPELDVNAALAFLDRLDPGGRHALASEAPFGRDGLPRWEGGCTFEAHQREWLIEEIRKRQARGSNVYYSVNRPCPVGDQKGYNGKCNVDDIIAIRALAFDIDIIKRPFDPTHLFEFIDRTLVGALRPSFLVNSGGGYQLIYVLKEPINVAMFRPAKGDDEEYVNKKAKADREAITKLANDFESFLGSEAIPSLMGSVKIDNMSNVDRVMRLPGTVNYPKKEKRDRGQVEALAGVEVDYHFKCDIYAVRKTVPELSVAPTVTNYQPKVVKLNKNWPNIRKIRIACEFLRNNVPEVDENSWYTYNVMFPLISAIHDEVDPISEEEAFECFMEAVSGGARYGGIGRGPGYFKRQWKSHHPELPPRVTSIRTLGTLFAQCKKHGMKFPWASSVIWDDDFERQLKELSQSKYVLDPELYEEFRELFSVKTGEA